MYSKLISTYNFNAKKFQILIFFFLNEAIQSNDKQISENYLRVSEMKIAKKYIKLENK